MLVIFFESDIFTPLLCYLCFNDLCIGNFNMYMITISLIDSYLCYNFIIRILQINKSSVITMFFFSKSRNVYRILVGDFLFLYSKRKIVKFFESLSKYVHMFGSHNFLTVNNGWKPPRTCFSIAV